MFGRVEERAAVVEDVVEEGLEFGPVLADPTETLGDEVDFCAEGVKATEMLAGGVGFGRSFVFQGEGKVVLVEEGVGAEEEKSPVSGEGLRRVTVRRVGRDWVI